MHNLSNSIYHYYLDHFQELPLDKQLHFASRLFLWSDDPVCRELLQQLQPDILPGGNVIDSLRTINSGQLLPLRQGSHNARGIRTPYFDRYPTLRRTATTLYWANLFDTLYATDARAKLAELLPAAELQELYDRLIADPKAIAVLSTHAVNFMYLYQRYVLRQARVPTPTFFRSLATQPGTYDLEDPVQMQLYIYLLTHSIIGESLFYTRSLPLEHVAEVKELLNSLETVITTHFDTVNLDNKFEFLVCCKLGKYSSKLYEHIMQEAARSVSHDGTFLVDAAHRQSPYSSFAKSEHRNVLYLMATREPKTARAILE